MGASVEDNDKTAHPWPVDGKMFEFRWRKAIWVTVRPWYEANNTQHELEDIWFLAIFKGYFPFFTWNIKWRGKGIHGYMGWKPIPVELDPAFNWNKLDAAKKYIKQKSLFVQLSMRGGTGDIG